MENKSSSSGIMRTQSDQLVETISATMKSPRVSSDWGAEMEGSSRKSMSKGGGISASPGGGSTSSRHIRKTRSAQMKFDVDELNSGATLSRASSASMGFSFTAFTVRPSDMADSRPFSDDDDDIPEDIETGTLKKKIQTEQTLPIHLKFTEVTYKVTIKGVTFTTEKNILHGITGSVNPGEVLALMGPSGSGKTTLLSVLGGRVGETNQRGSITYNDQPYTKFLKSRIGFVTQDDVLFPHLTVKETLTYAALLRLPKMLTKQEKEQRATDVISELGLERCQDSMIGGSYVRGISGGERKRVCIGNEIIINPSLLLLDEPTSGLDSTTALRIVQLLQDIAESGKTVITTIHQPSSRLYHKFDKLILLGRGSMLYFGKASEAMIYFSSIGCSPLISMNPAEFLLDLANGNLNDVSVPGELKDRVQIENSDRESKNRKPSPAVVHEYLVEAYEMRVAENEKRNLMIPVPIDEEKKSKVYFEKQKYGASWRKQFGILFWRGLKERRHDYFSWLRLSQIITTAIIVGLLWWQSDSNNAEELHDQAGLLFFIAVFWGYFPVYTAIFTFPQERAMLNKERAADMYRLSAYFVARTKDAPVLKKEFIKKLWDEDADENDIKESWEDDDDEPAVMIEPELAFTNLDDNMACATAYLHVAQATKSPQEKNTRLENMSWRIWNLACHKRMYIIVEGSTNVCRKCHNDRTYSKSRSKEEAGTYFGSMKSKLRGCPNVVWNVKRVSEKQFLICLKICLKVRKVMLLVIFLHKVRVVQEADFLELAQLIQWKA